VTGGAASGEQGGEHGGAEMAGDPDGDMADAAGVPTDPNHLAGRDAAAGLVALNPGERPPGRDTFVGYHWRL
jgi:hypothetical protein